MLRSMGPFQLVHTSSSTFPPAVQTSHNFLQYFGADLQILDGSRYADALSATGNVITIALFPHEVPGSCLDTFPVLVESDGIKTRLSHSARDMFMPGAARLGAVYLRPLHQERLELVMWGKDVDGLQNAARLIPTLTGAGQPDSVVPGGSTSFDGHTGSHAMGFLDYSWNISTASYLSRLTRARWVKTQSSQCLACTK